MLYTFVAAALAFSAPTSMVQSNAVVVRSSPVAMSTQYSVGRTGAFGAADKKKNPKTGSSTNLKGYTVGSRAPPMAVSSGTTIFEQYGKTRCETLTIEPQDPTSSFCCSVTVVFTPLLLVRLCPLSTLRCLGWQPPQGFRRGARCRGPRHAGRPPDRPRPGRQVWRVLSSTHVKLSDDIAGRLFMVY